MLPQSHFLFGTVLSLVLYYVFPEVGIFNLIVFLLASVLIDVDHYLYYVYRKGDWSLGKAFGWFSENRKVMRKVDANVRRKFYTGFCFLHGIEVLGLVVLLGYFVWSLFYFVALGFAFHLVLDHINQAILRRRFDKFSIVYDYFKYGDLKFVEEFEGLVKLKN